MKYQRAVNRRLDEDSTSEAGDDQDLALVVRCWPQLDDETLPRVVSRSGHPTLDEGWVVMDDPAATPAAETGTGEGEEPDR